MGGGVNLKNNGYWSAAGWAFRTVFHSIQSELDIDAPYGLYEEICDENSSTVLLEYVSADEWPKEKLQYFCGVVQRAFQKFVSDGLDPSTGRPYPPSLVELYRDLLNRLEKELQSSVDVAE